jgi:hypothetical protein
MKLDEDETLLQVILDSGVLSIPTMILLGSASKPIEKLVKPATCRYMKTWKNSLESRESLLVAEEDEMNPAEFESFEAFMAKFESHEAFMEAKDNLERKRSIFEVNSLLYRVITLVVTSVPLNSSELNRYLV